MLAAITRSNSHGSPRGGVGKTTGEHAENLSSLSSIRWAAIIRDSTLLLSGSTESSLAASSTDEGTASVDQAVSEVVRNLLNKEPTTGWDAYSPLSFWRTFRGLKFHEYQETSNHNKHVVWTFAIVYDSRCLSRRQAQAFIQQKMVCVTEAFRQVDESWKSGDHLACQDVFGPILQQRIDEMGYMGQTSLANDDLELSNEIIARNKAILTQPEEKREDIEEGERTADQCNEENKTSSECSESCNKPGELVRGWNHDAAFSSTKPKAAQDGSPVEDDRKSLTKIIARKTGLFVRGWNYDETVASCATTPSTTQDDPTLSSSDREVRASQAAASGINIREDIDVQTEELVSSAATTGRPLIRQNDTGKGPVGTLLRGWSNSSASASAPLPDTTELDETSLGSSTVDEVVEAVDSICAMTPTKVLEIPGSAQFDDDASSTSRTTSSSMEENCCVETMQKELSQPGSVSLEDSGDTCSNPSGGSSSGDRPCFLCNWSLSQQKSNLIE